MTVDQVLTVVGMLAGGGLVHLIDRWRYRRRPALDIVALAQEIAERATQQAQEIADRAMRQAAEAYEQARGLRVDLAAARVEIERLAALLRSIGAHP